VRVIKKRQDLDDVLFFLKDVIDRDKSLPGYLFKKGFSKFSFITFDELFMPDFFSKLCRYVKVSGDSGFFLAVVDPDPMLYFGSNFDFYGIFEFSPTDAIESYISSINEYPKCSPADAIAHNSNSLIFFSKKKDWAIYGSRTSDIAICAFENSRKQECFQSIFGDSLLPGIEAAAIYGYPEDELARLQLISSYQG